MPTKTISQLDAITTLTGTEVFETVQAGVSKKIIATSLLENSILNPIPATDLTASGIKADMVFGATIVFGEILYQNSNGKLLKAKGIAAETKNPGIAMALESGADTETKKVLLQGFVRNDAWAFSVGAFVYLSAGTEGAITQTRPATSGNLIQVLGIATHADRMYFNPQLVMVEI